MRRVVQLTHALLVVVFGLLAALTLGLGVGARVGPGMGHELLAIRTGSMEPHLPRGALAIVSTDPDRGAQAGDEIAFRLPSGTLVTHRVVEVVAREEATFYRTQGDANAAPDPVLVPAAAVVGTVTVGLPVLGYLLGLLSMPLGIFAILCVAGSLIAAIWLLEDVEDTISATVSPASAPGGAMVVGGQARAAGDTQATRRSR
jgi:signal peptidase